MRTSPSAVIFDYGNVLSQSQPPADTQAMAGILDIPMPQFTELYWRFRVEYDAAAFDPAAYWNTVAEWASRRPTPAQIATLIEIDSRSWSHPAPIIPQWARELRAAGLRTAILSNMPVPVRDYILGCPWLPEFDSKTFSCEVRICKPAREIYEDCLDKLGARPSDVLFLDDRESNIRAAQTLGLNTVLFTDAPRALREIEDRFSLPLVPKLAPMASNMLAGS
ncbi:MAG TPA: HAD family phosphatase [Nitrospira sp.]|nr:HAD family phosphatase [Nitrospira sp.]